MLPVLLPGYCRLIINRVEVEMGSAEVIHVGAGNGRSFYGPGDRYTFLVTGAESGGSMFALDCLVGAGGGPPPHRHLAEDERPAAARSG